MTTKDTQKNRLLERLQLDGYLTSVEIVSELHIIGYARCIAQLRRAGHDIRTMREADGTWRYELYLGGGK
jgi:hypothetical protein